MTWEDFTRLVPEELSTPVKHGPFLLTKARAGYKLKVDGVWLLIGDVNGEGGLCDDCHIRSDVRDSHDYIEAIMTPSGEIITSVPEPLP